ncbi:hypothetical protein QE152_g19812 [Popillia japonica]|uniref:Uncharacterized protein n=1 Tax=Popillia japonica TaxID=7064 RepID=A0AAW1KPW8_POPJA
MSSNKISIKHVQSILYFICLVQKERYGMHGNVWTYGNTLFTDVRSEKIVNNTNEFMRNSASSLVRSDSKSNHGEQKDTVAINQIVKKRAKDESKWVRSIAKKSKERHSCDKSNWKRAKDEKEDRKSEFDRFCKLSWKEKKPFVQLDMKLGETQRQRDRKEEGNSRRKCEKKEDETEPGVHTTADDDEAIETETNRKNKDPSQKNMRRLVVRRIDSLKLFLESLPKMESHYCRSTSNKLYLQPQWQSKQQLYELYKTQLPHLQSGQEVTFYSDGCPGQNRNAILSSALLNFAVHHKVRIVQKYLERGHTQMEADSMHSCVERQLRNKIINVSAD